MSTGPRWRWRLAELAIKPRRSPWCWVDLCLWALGWTKTRDVERRGEACREESRTARDRACYCGRWQNGQCP